MRCLGRQRGICIGYRGSIGFFIVQGKRIVLEVGLGFDALGIQEICHLAGAGTALVGELDEAEFGIACVNQDVCRGVKRIDLRRYAFDVLRTVDGDDDGVRCVFVFRQGSVGGRLRLRLVGRGIIRYRRSAVWREGLLRALG